MKTQTNRTILFEKINSEKENILSLIHMHDKKESLSDDEIKDIHNELEVNSFEEFMDSFSPAVYMLLDVPNRTVSFSAEALDERQIRIPLGQDKSIFWQIWELVDYKRRKVYSFKEFSQMGDRLLTNKDVYELDILRNRVMSLVAEGEEAYPMAKKELEDIISHHNDEFYLLMVFIHDVEQFCVGQRQNDVNRGIIRDNGKLQVRVVETAPSYKKGLVRYQNSTLDQYAKLVEAENISSEILRDVLLLPYYLSGDNKYELFSKYATYLKLYEDVIKRFWNCAKPKLEAMFGIKEFFEQQSGASRNAELVIANIAADEILDIRNKEKLDIYLNSVNSKVFYEKTIWYAILPNLDMDIEKKQREIRERFASSARDQIVVKRYEREEVISLMEVLADHKIQTFVSMSTGQDATFSDMSVDGMDGLVEALAAYEKIEKKDYFIPCFPNFVVISDSESYIRVGKKIVFDEMTEEITAKANHDIWLNNLEVGSAYVAAGMFAACQNAAYLTSKYRRGINENNPGVGYRFSEADNSTHTISNMLSETYEFKEAIVEDILKRSRGVIFAQKDGRMQILTDRVFSYNNEKKLLVSMVQTITYIERTLQKETQDFKKNLIIQFFQKRPGSALAAWSSEEQNCKNPILRQEETLTYELDDDENSCEFIVDFGDSRLTRKNKVTVLDE